MGFRKDGTLALNRKLVRVADKFRREGHTLILWTFGNRRWWREVARQYPVLRQLFHEVYSKDEQPGHRTQTPHEFAGRRVTYAEDVKDIRLVRGDVLIDNDPAHYNWAKRHGMESRYILVPSFGVA